MATTAGSGAKPQLGTDGNPVGPVTKDLMADRRQSLTLREAFLVGTSKARGGIVYSHYEHRNYERSYLGETGKV